MSYTAKSIPCGIIERTSKIALTATLQGKNFSSGATYAWSCLTAGVVFGTPALVSTSVVFPAPGEYTVDLTVTSSDGTVCTDSHKIKVDRVIEVKGILEENNDYFSTLLAAITWINTNDAANKASYTIKIESTTLDAAGQITCNGAMLRFVGQGRLADGVGLLIPSNTTQRITGEGKQRLVINALAVNAIDMTGATGAFLQVDNCFIASDGRAIACFDSTNSIQLENMTWSTSPAAGLGTGVVAFPCAGINVINCIGISNANVLTIDCFTGIIENNYLQSTGAFNILDARQNQANHVLIIQGNFILNTGGAASVGGVHLLGVQGLASGKSFVRSNTVHSNRGGAAGQASSCIMVRTNNANATLWVSGNEAWHLTNAVNSFPFVRVAGTGTIRVYNNDFIAAGATAAVSLLSLPGTATVAWNPAQFTNNVLVGALSLITPNAGVALAGANIQVP